MRGPGWTTVWMAEGKVVETGMLGGQPVQLCTCSLPPGHTQGLPRSEDTWGKSPTGLNNRLFHFPHFWGGKTAQGVKKISCSLVMFFCYSCYILAHFFKPQVKCVSACVCVCCIGRDSEKDESLLWLGQQNTVIFNYVKSICLKVNH